MISSLIAGLWRKLRGRVRKAKRIPDISNNNDAVSEFYDRHYDLIGQWSLIPGSKQTLGTKEGKRCRFCDKDENQTTFRDEAHAISEFLGNKSLFTNWECDVCNHAFGEGIENHLGNWSKPLRTFARIRGKKGVPTLKKGSSGGWRIEFDATAKILDIKDYEDEPIAAVDERARTVTFSLKRDPYIPMAVLKAFVKMGLTILPEPEVQYFVDALAWVQEADHSAGGVSKLPIIYGFVPGAMPNDEIAVALLRRKDDAAMVPYMFFVLAYGNEVFQVILPSRDRDQSTVGKPVEVWPFMQTLKFPAARGPSKRAILDMSRIAVERTTVKLVCGFESSVRVDPLRKTD